MSNSDPFTQALNKGLAELRAVLTDATERFESEMERVRQRTAAASPESLPTSAQDALNQMDRLARFLRSEAASAAGDVSDSLAAAMEEFSKFVYAAVPGLEEQVDSAGSTFQQWMKQATETANEMSTEATARSTAAAGQMMDAVSRRPRSSPADAGSGTKDPGPTPSPAEKPAAAKKPTAKKTSAKKSTKKASAKKSSAKKAGKKATAKKSSAKKSTKKAAKKGPAKKSSAKKSSAKKTAKKPTAKKAGKKAAKKSTAKKAAKKSTTKKAAKKSSAKNA